MSRALVLVLVLVLGPSAYAQEIPAGLFRAEDAPNDDGSSIAVFWPALPGERDFKPGDPAPAYEYVLSCAAEGSYVEVAKSPARSGWKADIAPKFGLFARLSDVHALVFSPLAAFSAQDLADAALGDAEAASRARMDFGQAAIDEAKKILAANRIASKADLGVVPGVVDEIGREVVLDRAFRVRLEARPTDGRPGAKPKLLAEARDVRPVPNWFDRFKVNNLIVLGLIGVAIMAFISAARRNPNLYLRRIGGLDAIDEALGRATEMGKPVLFVHGLETLQKVPTIAAINILGEIAKKVARFDTRLICTNYDPIVLTVSQETVKEGFLRAGRPDAYNQDDIFLAGAEQFSYVAAVDGIMIRQRPAANIYAGYFYAESLLLAETGASTGAIQIAATDAYTQLPFFVTTCDYTLMGEELYAASAYLSRDPPLLGSLRGQDLGKAAVIAFVILGTAAATAGIGIFKLLVQT